MLPIVTPEEMAAIDAAAPEPVEVLIGRAGAAVARTAIRMLGGTYGRTVVVLAGKGNNGNDGREAARRLRKRGVRVIEIDAHTSPDALPPADLVIDAAFGTGFRGSWRAPATDDPVLAVDIPSGVDGLTGATSETCAASRAHGDVRGAEARPPAPAGGLAGRRDRGCGHRSRRERGTSAPRRGRGCRGVAPGAARDDAQVEGRRVGRRRFAGNDRRGASRGERSATLAAPGYVRLGIPGLPFDEEAPTEIVGFPLPADGWASAVLDDLGRFKSTGRRVRVSDARSTRSRPCSEVVAGAEIPLVLDGDGLFAVARDLDIVRTTQAPDGPDSSRRRVRAARRPPSRRRSPRCRAVPRGRDRCRGVAEGSDDGRG